MTLSLSQLLLQDLPGPTSQETWGPRSPTHQVSQPFPYPPFIPHALHPPLHSPPQALWEVTAATVHPALFPASSRSKG